MTAWEKSESKNFIRHSEQQRLKARHFGGETRGESA
jgi:hypothetical protein